MSAPTDWKDAHAKAASTAIEHELVEGVIEEFMNNLGIADTGLPAYGIRKVALYAAQVARAQVLSFDPNLLRMTAGEATSEQLRLAAEATLAGVPTYLLDGGRRQYGWKHDTTPSAPISGDNSPPGSLSDTHDGTHPHNTKGDA